MRVDSAEEQLVGTTLDAKNVEEAVREALADVEMLGDLHASAEYRHRAAISLACRAVADALDNAQGNKGHAH